MLTQQSSGCTWSYPSPYIHALKLHGWLHVTSSVPCVNRKKETYIHTYIHTNNCTATWLVSSGGRLQISWGCYWLVLGMMQAMTAILTHLIGIGPTVYSNSATGYPLYSLTTWIVVDIISIFRSYILAMCTYLTNPGTKLLPHFLHNISLS